MGTTLASTTSLASPPAPLEMWGGAECSYVRVQNRHVDQFALSGHDARLDDLDRFAALGIRALRYPISWERMASGQIDWSWAEARLHRLRELGVRPIVGFVHHGSGPLPDGMLSPEFAPRLGAFAREVAERFPWIDAYTPVNEPGTTARFSGLYGLWHPHGRDARCFARCLLQEIEATRSAMRAIRQIHPQAQLIQTEDLGKIYATPRVAYQADFENERRWLTFDLLCGRVDRAHALRSYLEGSGLGAAKLDALVADPCPPDVLGMNHYVTSDRLLDERIELYPPGLVGGNGHHAYADVAALRVRAEGGLGHAGLLREVWARYRLPIAITEVQLACTREDQLRWLMEAWHGAEEVRREGVDVRAVTAWALLGAHEWDSLLTDTRGTYESGAFDLRAPRPRPTALTRAIRTLSNGGAFTHPVLTQPGWWRRPERLHFPPFCGAAPSAPAASKACRAQPLLIVGARGTLGRAFLRECAARALPARPIVRRDANLTRPQEVRDLLAREQPWAVINCAGYVRVDDAEANAAACERDNTHVAVALAEICAERGVPFLTFSSDLVFDGEAPRPYIESDAPRPLNVYGRSKRAAEERILALGSTALIVRTSAFFGPDDNANFATRMLEQLAAGQDVDASRDHVITPTHVPELAAAALDLLIDEETGIWHLANAGAVSWFDWARVLATSAGFPEDRVRPASAASLGWRAPRPRYSALQSDRGRLLSSWERALEIFLADRRARGLQIAA